PVVYRIDISNPGSLATEGVVVTDEIPDGLQYEGSTPPAELAGTKLRWNLGTLAPRGSSSIEVRLRATRSGSVTSCAEATSTGALKARDCVTTTVGQATIDIQVLGPQQVYVNDMVDFKVTIANRGQAPASGLILVDRFDPGLQHDRARSPIERDLGRIEAGKSIEISGLRFRATQAGRLCHTIEVLDSSEKLIASGRGCVNVIARSSSTPPPSTTPPPGTTPSFPPQKPDSLKVWRKCQQTAKVGDVIKCEIFVANEGNQPITGVHVVENFNANLYPTNATDGHKYETNRLSWMLPSIRPGATEHLIVHYRCEAAAARTCCSVDVRTSQGETAKDESCLQIIPDFSQPPSTSGSGTPSTTPTGKLTVKVKGNHNPVTVGKRVLYTIDITNESSAADHNIVVTVTVPPQMQLRRTGNTDPNNIDAIPEGQEIRFAELAEMRPGESLTWRVAVDTIKAGTSVLRVKIDSKNSSRSVFGQTETTIQAP
ncbi:MAG: DUF11 domain-containing protein, partial [Pirellulales bacterium]|nr:DUF11 domain-containing protein [Pirellulales bacterium]